MENFHLPGLNLFNIYQIILGYFISSLRVASFLISSPFFSTAFFPLQVRIVVSMSITIFIFPYVDVPDLTKLSFLKIIFLIFYEVGLGLSVAFVLSILFSVAAMAGEKISSTAGLAMASMVDPQSGGQSLIISTVLSLLMICIFLALDGHLYTLRMIIESYTYLPIGLSIDFQKVSEAGIITYGKMLYLSSLVMLPIVSCMILINFAGGIITRSAPTLNLFSFIFPVTLISVFVFLYLAIGNIANALSDLTGIGINLIDNLLHSKPIK